MSIVIRFETLRDGRILELWDGKPHTIYTPPIGMSTNDALHELVSITIEVCKEFNPVVLDPRASDA